MYVLCTSDLQFPCSAILAGSCSSAFDLVTNLALHTYTPFLLSCALHGSSSELLLEAAVGYLAGVSVHLNGSGAELGASWVCFCLSL